MIMAFLTILKYFYNSFHKTSKLTEVWIFSLAYESLKIDCSICPFVFFPETVTFNYEINTRAKNVNCYLRDSMILSVLISLVSMYLSIAQNSSCWHALLGKYIFSYFIKMYIISWLDSYFFKGVILVYCIHKHT